jgi:hypothetical protein
VVLVAVVQLVVVAAVEAAAVAPAAAKAAVVAVVAAPSVVGATLRSSPQLGRGTSNRMPSAAAVIMLLPLPPPLVRTYVTTSR